MNLKIRVITVCFLCNRHTRGAHGKVLLVLELLRWVPWGRVWRARVKRGPVRRLPPSVLHVGVANRLQIDRKEPYSVCTSRTPLENYVLMSSNGSILFSHLIFVPCVHPDVMNIKWSFITQWSEEIPYFQSCFNKRKKC